jgi:uncharacterized protein (TIGR03437 family)
MRKAAAAAFFLQALIPALLRAQISNIVVTNAASFQAGLPAPGSIGTIFCTGLSVTGVVSAPGAPLPLSLSGITVTVGGAPAPLFAVADLGGYQQVNFQVPLQFKWDTATAGPTAVTTMIVSQGTTTGTSVVPQVVTMGAFFRVGSTQYGLFQHSADYSLVTTSNPARVGETIIGYGTGFDTPNPPVPAGEATPMTPLYWVPDNLDIGVNLRRNGIYLIEGSAGKRTDVDPQFMGLAPGMVGVYQVNFVVPSVASGINIVGAEIETCNPQPFGNPCQQPGALVMTLGPSVLLPVQ